MRWPASRQKWCDITFLHWRYDVGEVQALLPPAVEVDTWDGAAWVSLTPFLMVDFRIGGLPPIPRLATFPETNLRTYVRGPDGRDGLWFLSLEAASLPVVLSASTVYGVPYRWADMSVDRLRRTPTEIRYRSHRRTGPVVGHDITVRVGPPCPSPTELDGWLTGRWRAWTTIAGRLAMAAVEHEPWSLHEATTMHLEESLLEAAGLPKPDGDPVVHYSPGVEVRLGPPRFPHAGAAR